MGWGEKEMETEGQRLILKFTVKSFCSYSKEGVEHFSDQNCCLKKKTKLLSQRLPWWSSG